MIDNEDDWTTKFFSQCYEANVLSEFVKLISFAMKSLDKFDEDIYLTYTEIANKAPVPPKKPAKKYDNSLDVSSIIDASSIPASLSIQFLEFLFNSSLKILCRQNLSNLYWEVFTEATAISSALRNAMIQRGHLQALLHLYLQE